MNNIKNIIFDYGNVIFTIDFKKTQHTFTELGIQNVENVFAHVGQNPLFDEYEKGNISSAEFRDGIRKITNRPELSDEEINRAWMSLLVGIPPVNHQIVLAAQKRYRTFLLSNINEIHLDYITEYLKREFNTDTNDIFFEKVYYSHLVRMRKPHPEIFQFVLQDSNLDPSETLYIDDSPQHIKGAIEAGFVHTHLLTADDSLESFMARSGLLS
ncbi:HAD family phosphatase [Pedobacter sp. SYSU D00535]|uniref:HAD family hydrolase n=1 Tax=Pedobacter sp. SYSU D00535 TaxID=2810308 RepID=UPI001A956A70|nr:HAD family phosphatase [Pedobacter sp. SYSU D00535]